MGSGDTSVSISSETGMTRFGSSKICALEGVKAHSSAFAAAINDAMADSEARLHRLPAWGVPSTGWLEPS